MFALALKVKEKHFDSGLDGTDVQGICSKMDTSELATLVAVADWSGLPEAWKCSLIPAAIAAYKRQSG